MRRLLWILFIDFLLECVAWIAAGLGNYLGEDIGRRLLLFLGLKGEPERAPAASKSKRKRRKRGKPPPEEENASEDG